MKDMKQSQRGLTGVKRVPDAQLDTCSASHGIVGIDTIQAIHAYPLPLAALERIGALTGGCVCRLSHPPWGSRLTVKGRVVRLYYYTMIQNPIAEALEVLEATQKGTPVAISQVHLACDLSFADLEALQTSRALIERHSFRNQLSVARDTKFYPGGYYVGLISGTQRQLVYVKAPLVSTNTDADVPGARFDQAGRGTVEGLPQRP